MALRLTNKSPKEIIYEKERRILNFFNLHNIYWAFTNKEYLEIISKSHNILFPDGRILSILRGTSQIKGPTFTRKFLLSPEAKDKKHFFIGIEKQDVIKIIEKTGIKKTKIRHHSLPYIRELNFNKKEINEIVRKLEAFNPHFTWICIGSPKQDILANQLFVRFPCLYLNVGAGMDFFLGKKKEAPKIFTFLGLEWLYRLITDPKTTKTKAWRSFVAIKYLGKIKVK